MFPRETVYAVRTVLHVAAHFDRLKQQARTMLDEFGASSRGFFTPTEDDQVRHLLVSYWHTRNALFEAVLENRDYFQVASTEEKNVRFLIAFGGALVLIDAARFLRDNVHERPVVREIERSGTDLRYPPRCLRPHPEIADQPDPRLVPVSCVAILG